MYTGGGEDCTQSLEVKGRWGLVELLNEPRQIYGRSFNTWCLASLENSCGPIDEVISKIPRDSTNYEIERTIRELKLLNEFAASRWSAAVDLAVKQEHVLSVQIAPENWSLQWHAPFVTSRNLSVSISATLLKDSATGSIEANSNAVEAVHNMSPALVIPLQNEYHELIGTLLGGVNCKVANEAVAVAIDHLCRVAFPEIALSGLFLTLLVLPCLVGCVLCWMMYHYISNLHHMFLHGSMIEVESDVEEVKGFNEQRSASNVEAGVDVYIPPPSFSWAPGSNDLPNSRTVIFPGVF